MSKWPEVTVGDIADTKKNALVGGPFGSNLVSKDYVEEGIPVIRGQNMGARLIGGDFVFVTEKKAQSLSANTARPGDLVFTQRGTLGQVALVPHGMYDTYIVSQSQMKLTADPKKADPLFLYYIFSSPEQLAYIDAHAITVGVPHTNLGILRGTPVILPPLEIQRRIIEVLGTLDDKIEINRQLNATLEQLARTLFHSWFVDFDPVRAKASGESEESICRRLGLTPELLALFPAALEDSVMGEVPVGWSTFSLGQLLELNYGKALKEEHRQPGTIEVYGSKGQIGWHNATLVKGPGIVVGRKGNAGAVTWVPTDFFPIDTTFYVVPLQGIGLHYLFFCLESHNLPALGADSAVPGLNRNMVYASKQTVPSTKLADEFEVIVSTLFMQANQLSQESRTLATLRDELLPKLLSGEIRLN